MSPAEEKLETNIYGEIEFIQYLTEYNYKALIPVKSLNNKYIEIIETPYGPYYASVFEQVLGTPIEDSELNSTMLYEYGKSLGKLHALSTKYVPVSRKWSYEDVLEWIRTELAKHKDEDTVLCEYELIKERLNALDKTPSNYGLIHYDFEIDNVFYDAETKSCSVIDFEDGMYHWYGLDIEQAFDSLSDLVQGRDLEEARNLFLEGYKTEFDIENACLDELPLFRSFIDLYSYTRIQHSLQEVFDNEQDWLLNIRYKLENKKKVIMAKLEQKYKSVN